MSVKETALQEPFHVVAGRWLKSAAGITIALTILVNPEIEPVGDTCESAWEGCLSVPKMRGWVPRYQRIVYRGFDPQGQRIEREVEGFHARVVQHECDHLDGILYPQRIEDMTQFGYEEELFEKHHGLAASC